VFLEIYIVVWRFYEEGRTTKGEARLIYARDGDVIRSLMAAAKTSFVHEHLVKHMSVGYAHVGQSIECTVGE
jgi:hypothetical protein